MNKADMSNPYFLLHLKTPAGTQPAIASLPFESMEAACRDAYDAIPDAAADLLREGLDPMRCSFLLCDQNDQPLMEVRFDELVRKREVQPGASRRDPLAWHGLVQRTSAALRQRSMLLRARSRTARLSSDLVIDRIRQAERRRQDGLVVDAKAS